MGLKVFIAVDDSAQADKAFNWYLNNLHKEGNEVVIGHVTEAPIKPSFAFRSGLALPQEQWDVMVKQMEEHHKRLEDKYCGLLKEKNITCHYHKGEGEPGHQICKLIKAEGVSMVVMGTRGKGTIRRTILGSVSDFVLHHAHVPVLICRE